MKAKYTGLPGYKHFSYENVAVDGDKAVYLLFPDTKFGLQIRNAH